MDRGFRLLGAVRGPGSAHIDGEVRGPVRLGGELRLGQQGRLEGEVRARQVEVGPGGRLRGTVHAARVRVAPGGELRGTLWVEDETASG